MIENIVTIEFNSTDPSQFWMHTDPEDRRVTVISGEGWKFQFEGEAAINMIEDQVIDIPKGKSHKIIKGTTDLVAKIGQEIE
jgi:hypothetical protein